MHVPTRQQFREEFRRIKALKKQGWTNDGPSDKNLKSWLRGWRLAGRLNRSIQTEGNDNAGIS